MTFSQPPDFHSAAAAATAQVMSAAPNIYELRDRLLTPVFLQNLTDAEKVQAITGGQDLQTRIYHPRRTVYAWVDPSDPINKALISVQVAFTEGKANNIQSVVAATDAVTGQPDTATFYTISNWSSSGGSLGKPFLMAVVEDIHHKYPHITNFATLSPMPGLRTWLTNLSEEQAHETGAIRLLKTSFVPFQQRVLGASSIEDLQRDPIIFADLNKLAAFCATQGVWKKERFVSHDGVAGFHLRNGAEAGRLCPAADASNKGFGESFGTMMNYVYRGDAQLRANAEAYLKGVPASGPELKKLLGLAAGSGAENAEHYRPK